MRIAVAVHVHVLTLVSVDDKVMQRTIEWMDQQRHTQYLWEVMGWVVLLHPPAILVFLAASLVKVVTQEGQQCFECHLNAAPGDRHQVHVLIMQCMAKLVAGIHERMRLLSHVRVVTVFKHWKLQVHSRESVTTFPILVVVLIVSKFRELRIVQVIIKSVFLEYVSK